MTTAKPIVALAIAAMGALAMGCGGPDYDHTELTGIVSVGRAEITRERIVVMHGTIAKVHVQSKDDKDDDMDNTVTSVDPKVLEVAPVITGHDYALLGVKPGHTEVRIEAEGKLVLIIDAWVVAQSAM